MPRPAQYFRDYRKRRNPKRDKRVADMVARHPYIEQNERITQAVFDDPMACFRPAEWQQYAESVNYFSYYAPPPPDAPARTREARADIDARIARQSAALRFAACEDCTLAYQLSQRLVGKCHPPKHASTPAKRLMQSEMEEHPNDDRAPDRSHVVLSSEKVVPE